VIAWEELDNQRFSRQFTAPLVSRLVGPPSAGTSVLSVGCGVGADVETLWKMGFDAHGVEPGYRSDAWSRRECPDRLHSALGQELPFGDGEFDAAVSFGVIEHVGAIGDSVEVHPDVWEQRQSFAREVARVVRPGGAIVMSTPNRLFPIDFFHATDRFGLRWHSPSEAFSVSYGDMRRLFVEHAGCTSIRPLGMDRAFVFKRSQTHAWGRVLAPVARAGLAAAGVWPISLLQKSPVMPFLMVHIAR
jgi:SAM-dependent methyltransferase